MMMMTLTNFCDYIITTTLGFHSASLFSMVRIDLVQLHTDPTISSEIAHFSLVLSSQRFYRKPMFINAHKLVNYETENVANELLHYIL